ncbi:hypothetical protein PS858_05189 [Pseudomonas fluorescens]|jgi:hypothetical protein|uniref:Uncharacterized protein n=2 Tax=Pseudomonas TaxID=286 RepID=A0A1H0KYH7_9PSED|nr:hypothetical protein [Pseudomonas fluorescens]SDO61009.1 hypothetical protein SAMN04489798_3400 [Pseudomonas arsenicoxydans]VVO09107.1 hypothetical protein PS704_03303 [Pseudomonas fluorescens]VVP48114.1 hypothetical protein PS858_05189 [Pseudomonas fluorescens]
MTTLPIDESTAEAAQLFPHQQPSSVVTPPELQKQEELQPEVVSVEPPVIVWRSLMLEQ